MPNPRQCCDNAGWVHWFDGKFLNSAPSSPHAMKEKQMTDFLYLIAKEMIDYMHDCESVECKPKTNDIKKFEERVLESERSTKPIVYLPDSSIQCMKCDNIYQPPPDEGK